MTDKQRYELWVPDLRRLFYAVANRRFRDEEKREDLVAAALAWSWVITRERFSGYDDFRKLALKSLTFALDGRRVDKRSAVKKSRDVFDRFGRVPIKDALAGYVDPSQDPAVIGAFNLDMASILARFTDDMAGIASSLLAGTPPRRLWRYKRDKRVARVQAILREYLADYCEVDLSEKRWQ